MSINLSIPQIEQETELKPRLMVLGVGGAGGNAVNNMIASELEGVDFAVANTDAQALKLSKADIKIQLGVNVTQGLGSGSRPEVGRAAAEEALEEIFEHIGDSHMLFVAVGMGGGTGTGAGPIIAKAAREKGILTVGVVTKPFHFEGVHRMRLADDGIQELEQYVDTLIIIPNQNLFRVANEKTTFADAFAMADRVLYSGVRGVTDLMVMPGLINLDFADVRSVMGEMGKAMMGTGEAEGETRAIEAAEAAISNPLLDELSMKGAKGVLINISGGMDMTLFEVDEAAERIRKEVDTEAYIIFGSTFDESMEGRMRVSVVATGIDAGVIKQPLPPMANIADKIEKPIIQKASEDTTAPAPAALEPIEQKPAVAQATAEAIPEKEEWTPVVASHPASKPKTVTVKAAPKAAHAAAKTSTEKPAAQAKLEIKTETPKPAAPSEKKSEQPKPAPIIAKKPAAMPSANASDPFIPPPPVERETGEIQKSPDPFAVAAMANGANKPETASDEKKTGDDLAEAGTPASKQKGPSLFERVTGTGRARTGEPATVTPHPAAESRAETADLNQILAAKPQHELGGISPDDRIVSTAENEDLLDIPAFLRRQAN